VKIHKSILWFNIFILGILVVNLIVMCFANSKLSQVTVDLSRVKISIFMLNLLAIMLIIGSVSLQIRLVKKFKNKLSVQLNRFMGITDSLNEPTIRQLPWKKLLLLWKRLLLLSNKTVNIQS